MVHIAHENMYEKYFSIMSSLFSWFLAFFFTAWRIFGPSLKWYEVKTKTSVFSFERKKNLQ